MADTEIEQAKAAERAARLQRIQEAATAAATIAVPFTDESVEISPEEAERLAAERRAPAVAAIGDFLRETVTIEEPLRGIAHQTLTPVLFIRTLTTMAKRVEDSQTGGRLGGGATSVPGKLVLATVRLADVCDAYNLSWADVGLPRSKADAIELVSARFRDGFARAEKEFPGQNPDPVGDLKAQSETPAAYFTQTAPDPEKSPRGHATAMLMVGVCTDHALTWDELDLTVPEAASEPGEESE